MDKLVFPPGGSKRTPPHKLEHTFKFKDYSPKVFAALRKLDNVDAPSYMTSVCGDFNFIQFIANSRSGQFFFYSHDGKYMIKTQTNQENRFLRLMHTLFSFVYIAWLWLPCLPRRLFCFIFNL